MSGGAECGEDCPRFTVQATLYNPSDEALEVRYGYRGLFVNAYIDKRGAGKCAPQFKTETGLVYCGWSQPVAIDGRGSLELGPEDLDFLFSPDIELTHLKVYYTLDLESDSPLLDTYTEPYALEC